MQSKQFLNVKTAALLVVLIYMIPFMLTFYHLGFTDIPPIFNSDMYLYLNMTHLSVNDAGNIISPWYGGEMNPAEFDYGRFSLSFMVFKAIFALCGHSWTLSLIMWNIVWILAIYFSAYYFFKMMLKEQKNLYPIMILALMYLLLVRTTDLKEVIALWTHIPSITDFPELNLSYSRQFFPQSAIPFLFLYLIFLVKLFDNQSLKIWGILLVLQFLALKTFPFLLALIWFLTLIAIIMMHFIDRKKVVWKNAIMMGLAFIVVDAIAWMSAGSAGSPAFKVAAFDFDLSKLSDMIGVSKYLLILFSLIIAFLKPKQGISLKVVVLSLGLASLTSSSCHLFLSSAFQIENHIYYMTDTILTIQMFYIAVILFKETRLTGFKRYITWGLFLFITLSGIAAGYSHYLRFIDQNKDITVIDQYFKEHQKDLGDETDILVMTPAYMPARLSPISLTLEHQFNILYHPDAHFLSSKLQGKPNVHKIRQAIYYYMIGKDMAWVEDAWKENGDFNLQEALTIPGLRLFLIDHNREWFLKKQHDEMKQYFDQVEKKASSIQALLGHYKKFIVVDYSENPLFKEDRLNNYLEYVHSTKKGRFTFKEYKLRDISHQTKANNE